MALKIKLNTTMYISSTGLSITPIWIFLLFLFTDEEDEFNVSVVGSENGHGGGTTSTSRRRHHHKIAMAYNAWER